MPLKPITPLRDAAAGGLRSFLLGCSAARLANSALLFACVVSACFGAKAEVLLDAFDAAPGLHYRVTIDNCADDSCAIIVHLTKDGHDIDNRRLSWRMSSISSDKKALGAIAGAGDPLYEDPSIVGWSSRNEDNATILAIRPVHLTATSQGVLLDQRSGFEHVKRQHTVIAALGGKLRVLWAGNEGAGPTYSTTAVTHLPNGRDVLTYFSIFYQPTADAADKVDIRSMGYDQASGKLVPAKQPLAGLRVGPFASIAAARSVRRELASCKIPFWVVPAVAIPSMGAGFALVAISSSTEYIERALVRLHNCAPPIRFSDFRMENGSFIHW